MMKVCFGFLWCGEKRRQERIFSVLAGAGLKQWTVQSVTFLDAIVAWGFGLY